MIDAGARAEAADLCDLVRRERATLARELLQAGALLFRGFAIDTPRVLGELVAAWGRPTLRYVGGDSPRTHLEGDVYTSTETPPDVTIPLHNEMSYLDAYPRQLWFACARPAQRGGETTLADGRRVWAALDAHVRRRLGELGVKYVRQLRGHSRVFDLVDRVQKVTKSWMETFEVDGRAAVEARCRELGTRYRWLPRDTLELETVRPAMVRHPETGEWAWFNQAHLFHLNRRYLGGLRYGLARAFFGLGAPRSHDARLGDDSALDDAIVEHVFDVLDAHTVRVDWEQGDVLLVDNLLALHGRAPYHGARRVLVAMTA